jgi:hypothetical protein
MHKVSNLDCEKHIARTRALGCYKDFVLPGWGATLRVEGDLIGRRIPDYSFMRESCDFQARFEVIECVSRFSAHRGAVSEPTSCNI